MKKAESAVAGTQSIRRVSAILCEVAASGQKGIRLSELAQNTLLDHTTVHRMLKALLIERWLERGEDSKRYVLGPLVFELGLCLPIKSDFRSAFEPGLMRLAQESQDTVYLNVRSGLDFVCMAREEGTFPIRAMFHDVGGRRPLGIGAAGIALLMELDADKAMLIIEANAHRFVHYGHATPEVACETLRRSLELGYATSRDLDVIGLSAIGLPIHNAAGQAFAAISIAMPTSRLTDSRCETLAKMMRSAIHLIEKKII